MWSWSRHGELLKGMVLTTTMLTLATGIMLAIRPHISVAIAALVLVVPVVGGVAIGGFIIGILGIILGFLVYDFVFIPPYYTLTVGASQNWIALGVYAAVVLIVSRLVSNLKDARSYALTRELNTRQLFEISKLLIGNKELDTLLKSVVESVQSTFGFDAVILLLEAEANLEIAAQAGKQLTDKDLEMLIPNRGRPTASLRTERGVEQLTSLALTSGGKPVGLIVAKGGSVTAAELQLLNTFANHAAIAIEQAQLRQQALRNKLLEETDQWRRALLGSVSHDLRTPLASIKTSASNLQKFDQQLTREQKLELLDTVISQTDKLTRTVANLLDMTRIEAGVLIPDLTIVEVSDIVEEAVHSLTDLGSAERIRVVVKNDAIFVRADHTLISQALGNLLENALRYSPEHAPVVVEIGEFGDHAEIAITDQGPGVPIRDRERIFDMFQQDPGGGLAGLGLAIVKAFVHANGSEVHVVDSPTGGAKFSFTLPLVPLAQDGILNDQITSHR